MARLDLHVRCPGLTVLRGFRAAVQTYAGALGVHADTLVEVTLASDRVIAEVHSESLGVPGPTDCIAFPLELPELAGPQPFLGAFYMGVEEVRRNAAALGHGWNREVAFVLAHGLLHLLGWEDGTEAERERMFREQERLVRLLEEGGRLPRLLALSRREERAG